ncbi:MAG: lysophospholipid acyltransferase family protein [Muribaculaceae bacterium]|nr:lysophospholipid acyltransferase family protein [Muribaculaceae bacterium]
MKEKIITGIFNTIARIPLAFLYLLSDMITFTLYHIICYRKKVVRGNLVSSFPHKSLKEIKKIEKEFYRHLGDQMVESIKTLHISDTELIKRVTVQDYDKVNSTLQEGRNAVLLMGHYCNWEWVQEITRYFIPEAYMASIYHPLKDKTFDNLFIKLRSRWNAHIVPMNKAPRILLNKTNMPWVCGFIADAWTWKQTDNNFTDFLHHKTWFITGPEEIGDKVNADYFYLEMNRVKRGYYKIRFKKIEPEKTELTYPILRKFWLELENTIIKAPPYWLWSHKRWK